MDSYFFDPPRIALTKGSFLLVTYIGSILFKQFSIEIVLPTILIYFLSNASDYAELAFVDSYKTKKIRLWSFGIFLYMLLCSIITFCLMDTDNTKVLDFVNTAYWLFYIMASVVWVIPMADGIRGGFDSIRNSANAYEQQAHSERAYRVMEGTAPNCATKSTPKATPTSKNKSASHSGK